MSDSAKKQKTKKQQPKDESTKTDYSTIPKAINEQIIDKLSPSTFKTKIFVFPRWKNEELNYQYDETIRTAATNDGPASWIHTMWFGIHLPFFYNDEQYERSLSFRMINTNDQGVPNPNLTALTLSASHVPDLPDYRKEGRRVRTESMDTWQDEHIDLQYHDFVATLERDKILSKNGAKRTRCDFYVHIEVPIPDSEAIELDAEVDHEEEQNRLEGNHEEEEDRFEQQSTEYERLPYEREMFDATYWWRNQDVFDFYNDQQLLDLKARWIEHVIQLIPQACQLVLPSSDTPLKTNENNNPNYKLTPKDDIFLQEDHWRELLKISEQNPNPNLDIVSLTKYVYLQNNVATPLSKAYSIVQVKEPDLKF